jgi:MurNAc alpha-1-phosphate uridylyltransferase
VKAILLAAGRGERMRPLTDETPKPLLKVRGKPLITWLIESLVAAGIRELVINHAHLGSQIEAALGDGSPFNAAITYSRETEALETAGGIANALAVLGREPFLAVNADVFCDYDFARLHDLPPDSASAHLVLVPNPSHHPKGDFALSGERVRNKGPSSFTFSGIGIYRPAFFDGIKPGEKAPLAPLLRAAAERNLVSGEVFLGNWHDVGTPARLAALSDHA